MAVSPSTAPPANDTTEYAPAKQRPLLPNPSGCGPIASPFIQPPFSNQFFKPHSAFLAAASGLVRKIDASIADNADKFLRLIKSFAFQHPIIQHLSSLTVEYRKFCQVQRRNFLNLNSFSSHHNFVAVLPGDSLAGMVVANGILNFLNLYNTLLVVRLVLTWFPNTPPAIVAPLSTICDPYLNIFRGLIPPLGGTLDLSPILAFLVLNAFTSTASALPAELPPAGELQKRSSQRELSDLTSSQEKWIRRILGNRSKNSKSAK